MFENSVIEKDGKYWGRNLFKNERDINSTVSTSTGKASFAVLYG